MKRIARAIPRTATAEIFAKSNITAAENINGRDKAGKRIQMRRRSLESLRKAENTEFELKRDLAILMECDVDPRWGEWVEEAKGFMKIQYRPSTLYSYDKTLTKWIPEDWKDRELKFFTRATMHDFVYEVISVISRSRISGRLMPAGQQGFRGPFTRCPRPTYALVGSGF